MDAQTDENLLERCRIVTATALASLENCVERVQGLLDESPKYNDKLASHQAYLTKHLVQVLGELRKLEAHDRNAVAKMTAEERDELVRAYLADLSAERRAEFREYLDELDASARLLR